MKITQSLFVADLHLKPQTWNTRQEIRGDSYQSFTQIIDHCLINKKSLILGGDIFDSARPDAKSVEIFRKGMDVMISAGLPVYVTQGQHDRANPPWPLALDGKQITYVHKQSFTPIDGGPIFYGLDQTPVKAVLDAELAIVPKDVKVLVLHQLAKTVFPMEGAYDFDPEVVPEHVRMLLIGDYHKKCSFKWHTNKLAYYPGSIHMCKIDEKPEKSVLNLALDGKGGLIVTDVPLITRAYTFKVVNTDEELMACVAECKALPKVDADRILPVVVVTYASTVRAVESTLREVLEGRAYFWPRPVSLRTVWAADGNMSDVVEQRMTLESCAGTFLNAESEEYSLLMQLLNSNNPEEILKTWRAQKQLA